MKAFWVYMIDLDLFFDISRDVAIATDFVQKWGKIAYPLHLSLCHSETIWDNAVCVQD